MADTATGAKDVRPTAVLPALILGGLFVLLLLQAQGATSNDLRSVWLAGHFFERGDIYTGFDGLFTMTPPETWLSEAGDARSVYPFIYPPLWAAVMSLVTEITSFRTFSVFMSVVHAAMITHALVMVWRIVGQPRADIFFGVGAAVILSSLVFALPMEENQPQIIVSFLILLGIERERAGSPVAAGIAMAFAAAIKVYPVIFALFWMSAGKRTATMCFAVAGGALGLTSIVVAGWPLHAAFLHELSAISGTVLLSLANFSLDPLIAALFLGPEAMTWVDTSATGGGTRWLVYEKPLTWRVANTVLLVVAVLALAVVARRSRLTDPMFWPLALVVVSWLSPLSWLYHYMTAFLFLPVLLSRFGMARGAIMVALIVAPTLYPLFAALQDLSGSNAVVVVVMNAALLALAIVSAWALRRGNPAALA